MSEPTRLDVSSGVATITLASPQSRNAFSQPLLQSLMGHLQVAEADDAVRVLVLTNEGNTFSAGADLKEDARSLPADALHFPDIVAAIDACPKPVVGRIAGHAAGGGAALVAACDLAVGHLDIRIGITEVRLGIAPLPVAAMMAHRMTRRNFFEAFLAADMMPATRAVELGLLNLAVPAEALDDTVAHYVNALVRGAPQALADTKAALRFMTESGVEAAQEYARNQVGGMRGPEAKEGVAAFLQKRNPDWVPD